MRRYLSSRGCFRWRVMKPHHMNPPLDSVSQACHNPKGNHSPSNSVCTLSKHSAPGGLWPQLHVQQFTAEDTLWNRMNSFLQSGSRSFSSGPTSGRLYGQKLTWMSYTDQDNPSVQYQAGFVPFSTFHMFLAFLGACSTVLYGPTTETPLWWAAQNQGSAAAGSLFLPGLGSLYE